MAKVLISKRAIFPKGAQKKFILNAKKKLGLTWNQLAEMLNISTRNLTDWKNEKFSISLRATKTVCKKLKIRLPRNIEIRKPFWYVNKGARVGGIAVYKKYGIIGGDPEYRKKKWREWWEGEGKYKKHPFINVCIPIKKPKKSKDLAEFVGIILGDGGITKRQLTITLNAVDDKEYSKFVIKLIKKLFCVKPSIYHNTKDSVNDIVVSRSELVKFCISMGLLIGNKVKQQVDVPMWIKQNNTFLISCLRGLIDTDGCIFTHSYKVNGKVYSYKKMAFSNRSKPLILTVYQYLKRIGLSPRFTKDGKDVRIESKNDVRKYFRLIGSHNPKHLKKYRN